LTKGKGFLIVIVMVKQPYIYLLQFFGGASDNSLCFAFKECLSPALRCISDKKVRGCRFNPSP